jgi:hypothetical protein
MNERKTSVSDLKGGTVVVRNAFLTVRRFPTARILLLTRTSQPFQTPSELDHCVSELFRGLPRESRSSWRNLIDMRQAPIRVHPSLDPAFDRFRAETEVGFVRVAVIVETPLGRVRADRLANPASRIVDSIEEALRFFDSP